MQSAVTKRVVIVGGGVAGTLLVKLLEDVADVTLIDPKDYFEVPFSALRCLVEPSFAERSLIIHSSYMKKSKLQMSSATDATRTEVITDSGIKVSYDFLVICTGSAYVGPNSRQDRLLEYQEANRKLAEARGLLIIGGGPVGLELAGEIITDFPTKKVTIVTSSSRLLEFLGPKVSEKAFKWLQKKKGGSFRQRWYALVTCDLTDIPEVKQGHLAAKHAGVIIREYKKTDERSID